MLSLVIHTATAACSVALFDDARLVGHSHEVVGRGHAERLVPMIGALLDGRRADRVDVDCGPGSFTGVRVGIAAARGLGIAWGVPVAGFSTLALIAAAGFASDPAAPAILVATPGGHGELFVQDFGPGPVALDEPRSMTAERAAALFDTALVLGGGAEALVAARGSGEARDALPDARDFARLPAGLTGLAPAPLYVRAPDARVPA